MADIVNARDVLLQAASVRVNGVTMQSNITVPLDQIEGAGLIIDGTKLVSLKSSAQVFQIPKTGSTNPPSITLTAEFVNLSGTPTVSVVAGSLNFTPSLNVNNQIIIAPSQMNTDVVTIRVSMVSTNTAGQLVTYLDEVTLAKVREGIDSISVLLTNENHTLPADYLGNVTSYSGCNGNFLVYQGINNVTSACTFSVAPGGNPDGLTVNLATAGTNAGTYSIAGGYPTNKDVSTVTFNVVYGSYSTSKIFTITKSKSGNGQAGKRGSRSFYISTNNTTWDNTLATNAATVEGGPILVDTVTEFNNAAGFSQTRYWDGANWVVVNAVIDGNLLVTRTVGAQHMVANLMQSDNVLTRGLTVRDLDGNIILAAGIPLDYSNVANGPAIPADNVSVPDITFNVTSNMSTGPGSLKKTGTTAAWDGRGYTPSSISGKCYVAAIARATNRHVTFGLSTNPTASTDQSNLAYGWYLDAGGLLRIVENGVMVSGTGGTSTGGTGSGTGTSTTTTQLRYVRDYLNGNSINGGNHWVELQVKNENGVNVALNKPVTANFTPSYGDLNYATDGDTASNPYIAAGPTEQYIQVDLGTTINCSSISVWHYYDDGRTYNVHRILGSVDGTNWFSIYDSDMSGTHTETAAGFTVSAPFTGSVVTPPTTGGGTTTPTTPPTGLSGVFHMGMHAHRLWNSGGYSGPVSPNPQFRWGILRDWDIENLHCAAIWKSDNTIDFSLVNSVYSNNASRGSKMIKTFGSVPTWASKHPTYESRYPSYPGSMSGPADYTLYKSYCKRFITQMRQYLWAVEGWNEPYPSVATGTLTMSDGDEYPQYTTMTPTELADTQKALYQAAKEVDPNLPVFSPPQAYVSGIHILLEARTSQNEPMSDFFDVLSWHPYNRDADGSASGGYTLAGEAQRVRDIMAQYNISKPIADTEHGWIGGGKEGGAAWYAMSSSQKAAVLYNTAKAARDAGLLCVCYYSYETDLIGSPAYDMVVAAKLDQAFLDLDTRF